MYLTALISKLDIWLLCDWFTEFLWSLLMFFPLYCFFSLHFCTLQLKCWSLWSCKTFFSCLSLSRIFSKTLVSWLTEAEDLVYRVCKHSFKQVVWQCFPPAKNPALNTQSLSDNFVGLCFHEVGLKRANAPSVLPHKTYYIWTLDWNALKTLTHAKKTTTHPPKPPHTYWHSKHTDTKPTHIHHKPAHTNWIARL